MLTTLWYTSTKIYDIVPVGSAQLYQTQSPYFQNKTETKRETVTNGQLTIRAFETWTLKTRLNSFAEHRAIWIILQGTKLYLV